MYEKVERENMENVRTLIIIKGRKKIRIAGRGFKVERFN